MPRLRLLNLLDRPSAFGAMVGVGLLLRILAVVLLASTPFKGDALSYYETARGLLGQMPYEPHWPPGVPALLLPACILFRDPSRQIVACRATMLLVYFAFCAALRTAGGHLAGSRATNLAMSVFAVAPIFIWTSVTPLTQLPTAALALGTAYFTDRCIAASASGERRIPALAPLGLCLAGMLLMRPSNVLLVGLVPLYVAWRAKRHRLRILAIPLGIVALFTGAWCVTVGTMVHRVVLINDANSQNVFYGNNPYTPLYRTWWCGSHKEPGDNPPEFDALLASINHDHPAEKRDEVFLRTALAHVRDRPDLFAIRTAARLRTFLAFDVFTSAQLKDKGKVPKLVTLVADAALYLLLTFAALTFPAVVLRRDRWGGVRRGGAQEPASGDTAFTREECVDRARTLLLIALLYAVPYVLVFAHPTFHFPCTPLVGLVGAMAGVALLETGIRGAWGALSVRERVALVVAVTAYAAIQTEWAQDLVARAF